MGRLSEKNKSTETEQVLLSGLDREFDFNEILGNSIIAKNKETLLDHMVGEGIDVEINGYLIEIINNRNAVLIDAFTDRLNELVSDEMISDMSETIALYTQKVKVERDIEALKSSKLGIFGSSIDEEMQRLSVDASIENKEKELKECTTAYVAAYQKSFKNSLISHELSDLYDQIKEIQYEQAAEISEGIELLNAKIGALKRISRRLDLKDQIDAAIDKKMNMRISETAVRSAYLQVPLVKALVK